MTQIPKYLLGAGFGFAILAQSAFAQNQFLIRSQQGQIIQTITDGATLTFNSEGIGQVVPAVVTVTYRGTTTSTIGTFDLTGSTDFAATTSPLLPIALNPNDTVTFAIQFNPTALGRSPAKLVIPFNEGRTNATITINLVGVTPDFGLSFALLPQGSQNSITSGGAIAFPDTALTQTSSALLIISNRGTGPGTVNNITSTGATFSLGGVPILPAVIQAGQDLRITLNFKPTQLGSSTGTVSVEFVTRSVSLNLTGNGIGPSYTYEFIQGSTTRPVVPNDTLLLPGTNNGDKSTAVMRVRNTGNADGVISSIKVSGAADFTLTDVPFLPLTLKSGDSLTFTITFTPAQAGTITGRVLVGDASFNLSGVGLGFTLTYAVTVGSATTTLTNNGNVILPPTQVGATSSAQFQISNTGNAPTFVNSISISGTTTPPVFAVANVPALPARIDGGGSISFTVSFAPTTVGAATATLKVDALTFNVSAAGTDPPPLPRVTFPGPQATVDAAQQLSVGVTLGTPYPVNLTGKLLLTFASDVFADDPSIQFAAGGRALNFVVPANTTRALFGVNSTDVRLQTGTVTGVITLAATFATEAGNINLTPTTAPATTITVRPGPPQIRSVQLANRTTSGFTILVTGYATTRSVSQMALTFTPFVDPNNKDLKLDTTSLNLNVDGPFSSYFQSTASAPFGSQFTATVNLNVRGDIDAIQSVAVTVSNAMGASNSGSVNLR